MMNAMKTIVMGVLCLAAAGVLGETYPVTDVVSLTEALGKAVDGDVIECAAGDYPLKVQIDLGAGVTMRGAGVGKTTVLYGKPRVFGGLVDIGCAESQTGGLKIYAR